MFRRFRGGRCVPVFPQRSLEALDRLTKAFGAETESLMMDRYDEMSEAAKPPNRARGGVLIAHDQRAQRLGIDRTR
jgi:hypothetical protein